MFLMERSEPSLIPEWLKGSPGGVLPTSHPGSHEDDASNTFSRHRLTQQTTGIRSDSNFLRGSASSERTNPPTIRRSNTGNSLDRGVKDTETLTPERLHYNVNRSASSKRTYDGASSNRSYDAVRDPHRGNSQEWEQDNERELRSSEGESRSVFSTDDREKFRDYVENRKLRISIPGKYESDPKLKRSMSMGLTPKVSDGVPGKNGDAIGLSSPLPSMSGSFSVSMQKAVFERNFPSLSTEDKSGSILMSPSGIASIASPRLGQLGSSRLDMGRAGLVGGIGVNASSINGGSIRGELWSSALAEAPSLNGSIQSTSFGHNGPSITNCTMASSVSSASTAASSVSVLNMAETITQNPPRVRMPPQVSAETQRLESLALKQSRQLIPMTPTLPKAMSLTEKSKSKATRPVENTPTAVKSSQLSGSLQSVNRSSSGKLDTQKHSSQGKLLVLKPSKDGSMTTAKPEGSNGNAIISTAVAVSAAHGISQLKKPHDVREASQQPGIPALRFKDSLDQDKRSSIQAQNRSEFFNTLRKKSTSKSESAVQTNSDMMTVSHGTEEENGGGDPLTVEFVPEIHSDGDREGLTMGMNESPELDSSEKEADNMQVLDSEEEEAAFMRSLGWEENAEGSELTEEEINAFYQMREKKMLNVKSQFNVRRKSWSSGMSSSDSDSDPDGQ